MMSRTQFVNNGKFNQETPLLVVKPQAIIKNGKEVTFGKGQPPIPMNDTQHQYAKRNSRSEMQKLEFRNQQM